MTNSNLPDENYSFWYETGHRNNYPALKKDITADIAVVGGGIAGILSAYALAKEGYKIALLEGRDLLSGTTGYTTAKLSAQHQLIYDELINRYDEARAKLYYQANMEGIAYVKQIAEENNIDCQLEEQDAFVYTQDKNKTDAFEKEADAYEKLGIQGKLLNDMPISLYVEAAVQMEKQAQFQPVTFLHGVLDVLKNFGAEIYEHSLVTNVNQDEKNDEIKLEIENGNTVTCSKAIFATHYPTFEPEESYADLDAEMSYALALKTTKNHPEGMYINDDLPKRTFRKMKVEGVDYLLVGGQSHPVGDEQDEMERYEDLYQVAKETFGETDVVYRWSSHDLMTKDRIPLIGKLHPDYSNIYTLTGFSKWGLANAATGAKVIADFIADRKNPYEAMYHPEREIPDLETSKADSDQSEDNVSQLDLSKKPDELKENEATIIEKDDNKIGVYKDKTGNLHHLDISCTHLGCDLNWNNGDKTWDCPCHGSRFAATGEVIEGPALKDLAAE